MEHPASPAGDDTEQIQECPEIHRVAEEHLGVRRTVSDVPDAIRDMDAL